MSSTKRKRRTSWLLFAAAALGAPAASAYIGPGAGLSLIGAFWGLILSLLAALLFIVVWPFRKALRERRQAEEAVEEATVPQQRPSYEQPEDEPQRSQP